MKKILALLLAALLLTGLLAGCGGSDTPAPTATPAPAATPEPADTPEETPEPADTPEPTEEEVRWGSVTRGTWDGNTYTSTYLGLQFEMPADWAVATDEDINQIMGIGLDFVGGDIGSVDLDALDIITFIDMMASDPMTGMSVYLTYERLVFPRTRISAQDYMELAAQTIEMMGMDVHFNFPGTTRIGNYDWYSYGSEMDMFGTSVFGRYFVNIEDGIVRIISIIYSDFSMYVDDVLAMFSAL